MIEFRELPEYPGYFFGDDGSVWSTRVYPEKRKLKLRNSYNDSGGYWRVTLRNIDNRSITKKVHRLIARAFHGECPAGMVCCHCNGNRLDNRAANLRWDTPESNVRDARNHGATLRPCGENSHHSKLTDQGVKEIRAMYASGLMTQSEIAKRFGVSRRSIGDVLSRKYWSHVA